VGLVNNLGTGVKDFFYEPLDGLASDGSLEAFLDGLGKGANSLLGNTVDGTFTAASKITGSLGQVSSGHRPADSRMDDG
jgi:vacuolar protein sorting-associated protein 13A/C